MGSIILNIKKKCRFGVENEDSLLKMLSKGKQVRLAMK